MKISALVYSSEFNLLLHLLYLVCFVFFVVLFRMGLYLDIYNIRCSSNMDAKFLLGKPEFARNRAMPRRDDWPKIVDEIYMQIV